MGVAIHLEVHGLKEALAGIKHCFEVEPVYAVDTAPIAKGSTFKPSGGHHLYHAAGCLVAVTQAKVSPVTTRVTYQLVKHPLAAEKAMTQAITKQSWRLRKRQGELSAFRTLDDFGGKGR
jgi:hypothetical protein